MQLTTAEQELLARRKSPDLTPREFLQATELQLRAHLHTLPDTGARSTMLAECEALRVQIAAADFNTTSMAVLNGFNQSLMQLFQKAMGQKR